MFWHDIILSVLYWKIPQTFWAIFCWVNSQVCCGLGGSCEWLIFYHLFCLVIIWGVMTFEYGNLAREGKSKTTEEPLTQPWATKHGVSVCTQGQRPGAGRRPSGSVSPSVRFMLLFPEAPVGLLHLHLAFTDPTPLPHWPSNLTTQAYPPSNLFFP